MWSCCCRSLAFVGDSVAPLAGHYPSLLSQVFLCSRCWRAKRTPTFPDVGTRAAQDTGFVPVVGSRGCVCVAGLCGVQVAIPQLAAVAALT
jgi:hypothetical protein